MRVLLPVVALLTLGCGSDSSPISPTPTPAPTPAPQALDLTGTWRGSLSITVDGTQAIGSATVTMAQTDTSIAATFITNNDVSGRVDGTLSDRTMAATFTGTILLVTPSADPNITCVGTAAMTGGVALPLRWTAPRVEFGNCTGVAIDVSFSLAR